jgi:FlaA1/EpsC-like NDP-sugar epimerase
VGTFVNVSTDKAANPGSVLGYSKRVAEGLTAYADREYGGRYISVRFGNVLGSRGSVLTAFHRQLESGGALTVTHPDVTRFFMTVEEAVQLVIQAGAIGRGGEVLVLDMGEPVRIADVARQLSLTAAPPVPIEYVGLRAGEKLHEELFGEGEDSQTSEHPLIRCVDVPPLDPSRVRDLQPTTMSSDCIGALLAELCLGMSVELLAQDIASLSES